MRLVIDLATDPDGRPVGSMRIDAATEAATEAEPFGDWLDLLRLLEACIDRTRAGAAGPPPTTTAIPDREEP